MDDTSDQGVIDRRRAMKLAAGGGVAAGAAWMAPKIEGMSVSPNYAAAATCGSGSMGQIAHDSNNCGYYGDTECWGNNCCGTWGFSGTATTSAPAKSFSLNGGIRGGVSDDSGRVDLTVNGIDPPHQRCVVNVSGNCTGGATFRGGGTFTFNNNGSVNDILIDCQGGGNVTADPDGQIRVNMTCTCL
jgi:hypothetical protein